MAAAAIQIIDSHLHILQPSRFRYHWLEAGSALDRDFHLADIREQLDRRAVVGGILIEATNTPEEISWLLKISESDDRCWGVIGWIHLEQPDAAAQIAHFAQHPNFKGVRLNWLKSRLETASLEQSMRVIGTSALVVDVLASWEHMGDIVAFVRNHADVSFVLEHLGGVAITEAMLPTWQAMMKHFAALPNVTVKISGYSAPASEILLRAYVDVAVDLFGSHRLMFGSNYPMGLSATCYSETVTLLQNATAELGKTVQKTLFYGTARQIYRLPFKEDFS